jgi:hypothetical protein
MKKTNKENPLTFFRKANEARQKVVKNSLTKARNGIVVNSSDVMSNPSDAKYYSMEPNPRTNVDIVNQSILDKTKSTSSAPNNPQMDYLQKKAMMDQVKQKYGNSKSPSMSKEMMDSMTNRPKSNTPMMDSMFQKKKGGSVKRKK